MSAVLLQDADGRDRVIELGAAPLTIGRSLDCSLRSEDPRISRQHARLWLDGDAMWIEDLGSHNGVYVGGTKVSRATVSMGEMMLVGSMVLRRVPASGEVPALGTVHDLLAEMLTVERRLRLAAEVERGPEATPSRVPLDAPEALIAGRGSRRLVLPHEAVTAREGQPHEIVKLRIQLSHAEAARDLAEAQQAAIAADRIQLSRQLARLAEVNAVELAAMRAELATAETEHLEIEVRLGRRAAATLATAEAKVSAMAAELGAAYTSLEDERLAAQLEVADLRQQLAAARAEVGAPREPRPPRDDG